MGEMKTIEGWQLKDLNARNRSTPLDGLVKGIEEQSSYCNIPEDKQHGLNEVLMVIENYQGICEHNFLVTESWLYENKLVDDSMSPLEVKDSLNANWQAVFYLRSDISYHVKSCESLDDLRDFQSGAFNDHSQSQHEGWYWDFQKDRCTPEALQIIQGIERSAPDQARYQAIENYGLHEGKQVLDHPLDELVEEAKDRLKSREAPTESKDKKPPEPER